MVSAQAHLLWLRARCQPAAEVAPTKSQSLRVLGRHGAEMYEANLSLITWTLSSSECQSAPERETIGLSAGDPVSVLRSRRRPFLFAAGGRPPSSMTPLHATDD